MGLAYGVGASGGIGVAKDLSALLIGMNPMDTEAIWEKMLRKTFWGQGGGGIFSAAMSGLDIAMWDIKGKALNVPLYVLLGGKSRDSIRAYASQLQFGWGGGTDKAMLVSPEQYADVARVAVSEGYDAIKVDVLAMDEQGNWNQRDLKGLLPDNILRLGYARLKAMRDAIGPDVDIIVEMHSFTSAAPAIQFGRMIEELGVLYYEEPVMPLNPKMMKQVADHVNIPLASGERIYWRWGYRPFLEDGSLSVIQPDICTCGGISEVKKICDMAHVYDVIVQIHVCGGPISTAAALRHLAPGHELEQMEAFQMAFYAQGRDVMAAGEQAAIAAAWLPAGTPADALTAAMADPAIRSAARHDAAEAEEVMGEFLLYPTLYLEHDGQRTLLARGYSDYASVRAKLDDALHGVRESPVAQGAACGLDGKCCF